MHPHLLEAHAIGERLRRLPPELAPPLSWDEFQRMAAGGVPRIECAQGDLPASQGLESQAGTRSRWRQVGLAAGIAVVLAGLAIWGRLSQQGPGVIDASHSTARSGLPLPVASPDTQSFAQAEASERWLAHLPVEPAVMRVGTRTAVANLEDRIAWMDDVLSAERLDAVDPAHVVALQRERARLVNSLAQVRYAETLVAAAR